MYRAHSKLFKDIFDTKEYKDQILEQILVRTSPTDIGRFITDSCRVNVGGSIEYCQTVRHFQFELRRGQWDIITSRLEKKVMEEKEEVVEDSWKLVNW